MLILFRKILIFFIILCLCIGGVSASEDAGNSSDIVTSDDCLDDVQAIEEIDESDSLQVSDEEYVAENNNEEVLSDDGEFIDVSDAYDCLNEFRTGEAVWQ